MKKTFKSLLALMAGAMVFTACSSDDEFENINEQIPSALKPMTFTAFQEGQDDATRAEIDGLDIKWSPKDKISIFDGVKASDGSYVREFTLDEGEEGKTSASFSGEAAESETYYALYPSVVSKMVENKYTTAADISAAIKEATGTTITSSTISSTLSTYIKKITGNTVFAALSPEVQMNVFKYMYEGVYIINDGGEKRNATSDEEVYNDINVDAKYFNVSSSTSWTYYVNKVKTNTYFKKLSKEFQDKLFYYLIGASDFILEKIVGVERNSSNQFGKMVIPSEQTVAAGEYVDPSAMLMIGMSDDKTSIEFKNVCAYVKVTPEFDCSIIALTSNGAENLAGTVTVDYNGGAPTTTVTANGTNAIYLTGSITSGNAYYIAVRPEALESGFKIEFITADGSHFYQRSSSKTLSLARNKVINLGSFSTSSTWTIESATSGTADGHDWILVSPTLKLATTVPAGTESSVLRKDADNLWGANWVLPSIDEFRSLSPSLEWDFDISRAFITSNGIFRNVSYNPVNESISNFWTSTYIDVEGGTSCYCYTINGWSYSSKYEYFETETGGVLYKYIGE